MVTTEASVFPQPAMPVALETMETGASGTSSVSLMEASNEVEGETMPDERDAAELLGRSLSCSGRERRHGSDGAPGPVATYSVGASERCHEFQR